ncbi:MAG: hypothetical protein JWQ69_5047 [Pseudomonas sp.]|nr:hypothetical protein [Pseudomonas sp.]
MSTHARFSAALLDPRLDSPAGLVSYNGSDPAARFAVYRNNVFSSLINALADSYPVVAQLVGDEFFAAMGRAYVQSSPPRHPVITDYGDDFALFIEDFEPAASLPYLADVARLERLRVQAYHCADEIPVSPQDIAQALTQPDALGDLGLQLHSGLALLRSAYGVASLWGAHQPGAGIGSVHLQRAENALVLRCGLEVEVLVVNEGTAAFIQGLQQGLSLGPAATQGLSLMPEFDLSQCLALLIRTGVITHLLTSEKVTS